MNKQHYIEQVSTPARLLSMVTMTASTLVCSAFFLVSVAIAIVAFDKAPLGPLLGCLGIFGTLTVACGWISIRLLRKHRAANGQTVMPEWFIQGFGVVFLIGICCTAMINGRMWLFGEAVGVAFAMIGVRQLLNQRLPNHEVANKTMDVRTGNDLNTYG